MKLYIPPDIFMRQYGPYTYFHNQKDDAGVVFRDSELFIQGLSRIPSDSEETVARIASGCSISSDIVRRDYIEWLSPLIKAGFLKDTSATSLPAIKAINDDEPQGTSDFQTGAYGTLVRYFMTEPHLVYIQMDITQACTERCVHCYLPDYPAIFLPYEDICRIFDEFAAMGGLCVVISGGECMLHPDFARVLEYALMKDLEIRIFSNLTLCNDVIADLICKVNVAKVQVSVHSIIPEEHDAITRRPGSWEATMSAVRKLISRQVPVSIVCAVMKQNYKSIPKLAAFANELGLEFGTEEKIMAKEDHSTGNFACRLSEEELFEYLAGAYERLNIERNGACGYFPEHEASMMRSGDELFCDAGLDKICVTADGNYYVCAALQGYPLGNCTKDRISDLWAESEYLKFFRSLRWRDVPKCLECPDAAYCSFCFVHNYNETGDVLKPSEYFCKLAQICHHQHISSLKK